MNFYEFVNKHRVEEFKQRIQQPDRDQLTLLGHAFDCGFNSKSTFNHIFNKSFDTSGIHVTYVVIEVQSPTTGAHQ